MPLCWNVYYSSFNSRKIVIGNIFDHSGFYKDCVDAKKKHKDDKPAFAESVKRSLMYYFWCKCEWEIILDDWPDGEMENMRVKVKAGELYDALNKAGIEYKHECIDYIRDKDIIVKVFPAWRQYQKEKIDVFDQVNNNWDVFIDYLWEHRNELRSKENGKEKRDRTA